MKKTEKLIIKAERDLENLDAQITMDLLSLVLDWHELPTIEEIETWTPEQCEQAECWVSACHLEASDNDVTVPLRPSFLPRKPRPPICTCVVDIWDNGHTCGIERLQQRK